MRHESEIGRILLPDTVLVVEKRVAACEVITQKSERIDSVQEPAAAFFPGAWVNRSIGDVEIHAVEGIARHLRPDAVLLDRDLVNLDVIDGELAGLLVHPEIDVVIFVLAA